VVVKLSVHHDRNANTVSIRNTSTNVDVCVDAEFTLANNPRRLDQAKLEFRVGSTTVRIRDASGSSGVV